MKPADISANQPAWKIWHWKLHWQILFGLLLGALLGYLLAYYAISVSNAKLDKLGLDVAGVKESKGAAEDEHGKLLGEDFVTSHPIFLFFSLGGDLFLNGLKMVVVPLVTSSIILAVAGLGAGAGVGRMGFKTLAYYMSTSLVAILIGLFMVNLVNPGATDSGAPILDNPAQLAEDFSSETDEIAGKISGRTGSSFLDVFRKMIPSNPFGAAVEDNLLGLIIVSLMIGVFMNHLSKRLNEFMQDFWQSVHDITFLITNLVLRFAPIGVGLLMASTISENYSRLAQEDRFHEFLGGVVSFALTAFFALCIHFFIVMPLILIFVAKVNPLKHYKAMIPAMFTAFSTSSSNATLPVTLECINKNAGVSEKTSSFVLPLGATVNMDGTALYECVAAIFIAQAFGIDLSFSQQFFVVVVALLTSIGVAGVPSASLVAIVIILQSLTEQLKQQGVTTVPLEAGLPILLVFDRLLDMCRTVVNIFSDSCGAVVIAKSEGETDLYPNALDAEVTS